jgi:hypothetical protein
VVVGFDIGLLFSAGVVFLLFMLWQAKSKINISNKTALQIAIIRFGCSILTLLYFNPKFILPLYHKN